MKEKILLIKLGALGDFIFALGIMKYYREKYAGAHLTLLTSPGLKKLGEQSGYFDEIIVDNRKSHDLKNWWYICKTTLADGGYKMIYDIQVSRRTRKKYYPLARFLTKGPFNWADLIHYYFNVTHVLPKCRFTWGKETVSQEKFPYVEPDVSFFKGPRKNFDLLPEKYALMVPGCSAANAYKRWPAYRYAELARKFADIGIPTVILGTNAEAQELNYIEQNSPQTVNMMGKSDLFDIPAIAEKAVAVVGNDTGPAHIASFCKKPTAYLFIRRNCQAARTAPNVVNFIEEKIEDTSADAVFNALQKLINQK
ncbi:MAG: glycosyltransferase family 9 protein [Lactobacillales bacterium]|jgi:ADP-heptose:LPS heptosyltransferase|nr:glycosyltransferase family 9 protein [Lactobacillales bacterium]